VRLETLARDGTLALVIDDPRGARDIPRAAEAEGYDVIEVVADGPTWRILIGR
jgi:TusA-related sulfurtransferase